MKEQAKNKAIEIVEKMAKSTDENGFINSNKFRHKNNAIIAVDLVLQTDLYSQDRDFWIEVKDQIDLIPHGA